MTEVIQARSHTGISSDELAALQQLFNDEYLKEYGPWNPDQPYGYSPADIHVMAFHGGQLIAHVGFQRRLIQVGKAEIVVAGTGGVLVDSRFRGTGIGSRTLRRAQSVMREDTTVDFGFLGCREEVVPFYESAGWTRVYATERCISRLDQKSVIVSLGGPNLVCSAKQHASQWPTGDVDLRGTPW